MTPSATSLCSSSLPARRLSLPTCVHPFEAGGKAVRRLPWMVFVSVLVCLSGVFFFPNQVQADSRQCLGFYKKKQYMDAASCFLELARQLQEQPETPATRPKKGRFYKNAALSYRKAAALQKKDPAEAAYLRELALQRLTQYIKEKLYETPTQARNARILIRRLMTRIGYTRLSVFSNASKAMLRIQGHRFEVSAKAPWKGKLRPGSYRISFSQPGATPQTRTIELSSFKPRTVTFYPAQEGGSAVGGWITTGVAIGLAAVGGVLVGLAFLRKGERDNLALQLQNTPLPNITQEMAAAHNQANSLLISGISAGGVGIAVLAAGVAMLATRSKPRKASIVLSGLQLKKATTAVRLYVSP